ncbi:hypothetical protein EYF80_058733 [Liparis tanakae]|uniref:Uncharacterized protein n=1 Tax=Liparis tanakae TaxID=230148 RepID=A0A4Z2EQM1_9TELE|nr:hypothetical protein EYF80_058733 [Liparis tanakae]
MVAFMLNQTRFTMRASRLRRCSLQAFMLIGDVIDHQNITQLGEGTMLSDGASQDSWSQRDVEEVQRRVYLKVNVGDKTPFSWELRRGSADRDGDREGKRTPFRSSWSDGPEEERETRSSGETETEGLWSGGLEGIDVCTSDA